MILISMLKKWKRATWSPVTECGTEYEVVGVEPLEISKVEEGIDEDEDDFLDEDEEEE